MKWLSLLMLLISVNAVAQNIGIGTTKPQSKLHIAGDLRVDSLAVFKTRGLVLHNESGVLKSLKFTGNKNDVLHGDGTFSAAVAADASWLTTGNAGTDPAVNFIGTTDAQPLRFRVGNNRAGEISHSTNNVSLGLGSLFTNTSGTGNTAIGAFAMQSNTTGFGNVALGNTPLNQNTTGSFNIAIGSALGSNTTGGSNIAIGPNALAFNVSGGSNVSIGAGSMLINSNGSNNVFVGVDAGAFASGVSNNVGIGVNTLSNSQVADLVAVGNNAMNINRLGVRNTAIGTSSLAGNQDGSDNTAGGYFALNENSGSFNTAFGARALSKSRIASRNTAVGAEAMFSTTSGSSNVAVGGKALWSNTTGFSSVAIGDSALYSNKGGTTNTAVGELAIQKMTGGNFNVAFGSWTLKNAGVVSNNTAVGHNALSTITFGSNNTALGFGADVTAGNLTNATAIGYNTKVNASNKVRIGNASVTKIEGQVAFTTPSDGRYKFNVREDVSGLMFIMRLRPVTYQFDVKRFDGLNENVTLASYNKAQSIRRTGFIAQEVEQAANASGYDFNGVNKPESADEYYTLSYESFVVPLVKAVQEQQQVIEKQQAELDELKALVKEMLRKVK